MSKIPVIVNTTNKKNDKPPMHQVYPILTACLGSLAGWRCKKTLPKTAYILCLLGLGIPDLKIDLITCDSANFCKNDCFFSFSDIINTLYL